ncbi:hypothetical protein [Chromobacterium subtsugae]|uniref:hypothetical protein n=1 Tax=Chromobacterium subtsugae TaxID=251747 RepID=UPI0007F8B845|nr:hypothetical protein [Chromobacterium subtsugae]OBU86071.1 hypothetical protein MY55_12095 [Chromobacterium subtsugae]
MKLSQLATIRTNFPEAHFWIIRRGSADRCGKPIREFNPEHIGIRIEATDMLLPDYLYYVMMHIHHAGYWQGIATGSLSLVNIKVSDVRNIQLPPK